jgi:hypothetical protein
MERVKKKGEIEIERVREKGESKKEERKRG